MKLKVFTVYDSKAEAFAPPFFMQSTGQAIRAYEDTCNDQTTQFNKHPGDFTLFEIGLFDDQTGVIINHESKVNLGTALEHMTQAEINENQPNLKGVG